MRADWLCVTLCLFLCTCRGRERRFRVAWLCVTVSVCVALCLFLRPQWEMTPLEGGLAVCDSVSVSVPRSGR